MKNESFLAELGLRLSGVLVAGGLAGLSASKPDVLDGLAGLAGLAGPA